MGLSKHFKTDSQLEKKGIVVDYGETRITIARAGGANKKFTRMVDQKTKPFRRAIALGTFDDERSNAILREVYAHAVVLSWEENVGTVEDEKWEPGICPADAGVKESGDKLLPVTPENIMLAFSNLPDMFIDIQNQAQASALFRADLNEVASGN